MQITDRITANRGKQTGSQSNKKKKDDIKELWCNKVTK